MAEKQRLHPRFDPDNTETRIGLSNHIDEIAQVYQHLNELRMGRAGFYSSDPDGPIRILLDDSTSGMLYMKSNGEWKCVTPITVGDSDPNLDEIQNYHLHYYPTANELRFYRKSGDTITWTTLYPKSTTANVDAMPTPKSGGILDESWVARYNPIPLSEHNTEQNKIRFTKGDRGYLELSGNDNPVYIIVNEDLPQLFDIYVEYYDSAEGTGCWLAPNMQAMSVTRSGFYADQTPTRGHYSSGTDRIWFGAETQGIAVCHFQVYQINSLWISATTYMAGRTGTTTVRNRVLGHAKASASVVYLGSFQGGTNLKGRVVIERVW